MGVPPKIAEILTAGTPYQTVPLAIHHWV